MIFKPVNHNLTITSFYRRTFKQNTTWINLNFLFSAFRDGLYPKGKFQIKWIYIRVNKCISEQHLIVDLIFQLSQRDYILISIFPFSLMGWRICVVKKSFRIAFSIIWTKNPDCIWNSIVWAYQLFRNKMSNNFTLKFFFREWAGVFAKSFYLRDPCKPPFWEQFSSFATSSITFSFLFHWFDIAPQNDIYLPKYVVHNGRTVAIKFKITLKIKWSIHYTWFCRCWGEVDLYCLSVPSDFSPCRCTPYSCKHLTFA